MSMDDFYSNSMSSSSSRRVARGLETSNVGTSGKVGRLSKEAANVKVENVQMVDSSDRYEVAMTVDYTSYRLLCMKGHGREVYLNSGEVVKVTAAQQERMHYECLRAVKEFEAGTK